MPEVYIVILNYKNWRDVIECLESLFRSTYKNFKVFVVDNASGNNSLEHLMEWANSPVPHTGNAQFFGGPVLQKPIGFKYFTSQQFHEGIDIAALPGLIFVQHNENLGFANGNNVVLKKLQKQNAYIWMLNPDMVAEKNTLFELVNYASTHEPGAVIGTVNKFYSDPEQVHLYGGGRVNFNTATTILIRKPSEIPELDFISGGSLFTHASTYEQVGFLPENYFLYWEETDWCYQARQKGHQMHVCLTAVCYDKISTTIGKSYFADFYYTRNGLMFVDKYKKNKIPLALFFAGIRMLKRIVTGRWKRARGVYNAVNTFWKSHSHENK